MNKAYFKRFNAISRNMPTMDDLMIIANFIYKLIEGEIFHKLVGQDWNIVEELIKKLIEF